MSTDENIKDSSGVIARDIGNVYLNALVINLDKPKIPVTKIESDEGIYSEYVKPWLEGMVNIAYWTPLRRLGDKGTYISYATTIDLSVTFVRSYLDKLKDKINIKTEEYLTINRNSVKMLEVAIMKKFISVGWRCSRRYKNVVCYSANPLNSKYLFTFHRAIEFVVVYIDNPLLVLRPRLRVIGPSLEDLLNEFGVEGLQKVINMECVALHKDEGKYRKAILLEIREIDKSRHVAKVIFYNGTENEVDINNVRLVGNVLRYKKLIVELLGEQIFEYLKNIQRSYSFSLGPKESSFKLARSFKDEILHIIRYSDVFPFRLGGVNVDIELDLFRVR